MDERIERLELQVDLVTRELEDHTREMEGRTEKIHSGLTGLRDDISGLRQELAIAREAERLQSRCETLEEEVAQLRADNDALRQAVVRYAIACGTVDVKTAMMRREEPVRSEAVRTDLQQAIAEEQAASEALRRLARQLPEVNRAV